MEAIKFDLEIPFWCSFADFGSLNIKLTYPFPPPTTLFGLIQNAMELPAIHTLKEDADIVEKWYIDSFNNLKFALILKDNGELIEDFSNIHKGNREKESIESELESILKDFINKLDLTKEEKKQIKTNKLRLKDFNEYYFNNKYSDKNKEEFDKIVNNIKNIGINDIFDIIKKFWEENYNGVKGFNLNKYWISTQIHRQRIITPKFNVFVYSDLDDGLFSLKNIYNALKNPKRSLYIGESDDVVNILNLEIVKLEKNSNETFKINSVLPGIYEDSELVKIPIKYKFDINHPKDHYKICSIPKKTVETEIESYNCNGDNIVFL